MPALSPSNLHREQPWATDHQRRRPPPMVAKNIILKPSSKIEPRSVFIVLKNPFKLENKNYKSPLVSKKGSFSNKP